MHKCFITSMKERVRSVAWSCRMCGWGCIVLIVLYGVVWGCMGLYEFFCISCFFFEFDFFLVSVLHPLTGVISWEKPKQLGDGLDIEDPPDVWEKLRSPDGKSVYYYHALTGRTSYLSEDEAAKVVQSIWRKRMAREFAIGDFLQIVRALRFQRDALAKYQKNPESLSSIINYALLCHTQTFDFVQCKMLYKKAFKMAPNNPVLLNAYALFTLADCSYPREKTFVNSHEMMGEAVSVDRNNSKFEVARTSFFHWSCVTNPTHPIAWLNWALIMQVSVGCVCWLCVLLVCGGCFVFIRVWSTELCFILCLCLSFVSFFRPTTTISTKQIVFTEKHWGVRPVKTKKKAFLGSVVTAMNEC
jgi:hypothetical protein